MILQVNQLPGWEFQIDETSAGVYRVTGRSECGHRVERLGTDPDALRDSCRITASAMIEPGVAPDTLAVDQDRIACARTCMVLRLSDRWASALLGERETGMGYHVVTIRLKDGRSFDGVTVTGGIIASVDGNDDIPFSESDIAAIAVTHDRRGHHDMQEPAPRKALDEARPMTGSQSPERHEFFVCHDYGQGGLWAIVRADSAEQVRQRFPGLAVLATPPAALDAEAIAAIRRSNAMAVEDPPVGWLADYLREIG